MFFSINIQANLFYLFAKLVEHTEKTFLDCALTQLFEVVISYNITTALDLLQHKFNHSFRR